VSEDIPMLFFMFSEKIAELKKGKEREGRNVGNLPHRATHEWEGAGSYKLW